MTATPELFQFRSSHFNEKARWALDFKRIPHVRHSLLPGPHRFRMQWLSGQAMVPVLRDGATVVAGSSQIITHLEATRPDPPLVPTDPVHHRRAVELQNWFDDEIGPAIRLALFHELFQAPDYLCRLFSWDQGPLVRMAFRAMLPGVRLVIKAQYAVDAENAVRAREKTREALDLVAREAGPDGYLVGDRFSVADLTAAALLSPATNAPGCQVRHPEPWPPVLLAWWKAWETHPGVAWVKATYGRHRGEACEVAVAA